MRLRRSLFYWSIILILGGAHAACVNENLSNETESTSSNTAFRGGEQTTDHDSDTDLPSPSVAEPLDWLPIDAELDQFIPEEEDMTYEPCQLLNCGENGRCVLNAQGVAACQCDERYDLIDGRCSPADRDADGFTFMQDCADDDAEISPNEMERCDQIDQDCDGEIDEGACAVWILEPRSNRWTAYGLDAGGPQNLPTLPIKAAWDIESLDLAFVVTETGIHELRPSTLVWGEYRPFNQVFSDFESRLLHGAFATSVPASHLREDFESVTIHQVAPSGLMRVWLFKFDLLQRRFSRYGPNTLYGDAHDWDDDHAPPTTSLRAGWIDVGNARGLSQADPSELCGANAQSSDPYSGLLSSDYLYIMESGYCFQFSPAVSLVGSPLDLPNAPSFDEIGAAFWHQGALYLFRGD